MTETIEEKNAKRKHFTCMEYTLFTSVVYSVQGPERCARVLYNRHLKKYSVDAKHGKQLDEQPVFPADEGRQFDSIFDAKMKAIRYVQGGRPGTVTVK